MNCRVPSWVEFFNYKEPWKTKIVSKAFCVCEGQKHYFLVMTPYRFNQTKLDFPHIKYSWIQPVISSVNRFRECGICKQPFWISTQRLSWNRNMRKIFLSPYGSRQLNYQLGDIDTMIQIMTSRWMIVRYLKHTPEIVLFHYILCLLTGHQ